MAKREQTQKKVSAPRKKAEFSHAKSKTNKIEKKSSKKSNNIELNNEELVEEKNVDELEVSKTEEVSNTEEIKDCPKADEIELNSKVEEISANKETTSETANESELNVEQISTESQEETPKDESIGLSSEIVEEKLKQALETQSPKKKKKSVIINLILLLVNIVFMVFIVKNFMGEVGDVNFGTIVETQGNRLWWLAGGLLAYVFYMLVQMLMYKVLIKSLTGKKRYGLAYDVAVVGKYYDNVTPFAVGGQPMQIVRLATNNISAGVSASIPIIKLLVNTTVSTLIALAFFIFGLPRIPMTSAFNDIILLLLEILGIIGLIISVIAVIFMVLVSSGSLFTRSFISGILRLGYKMKLVKNYRKSFKKFINQIAEYKSSMAYLVKHKLLFFKLIVLSILECITYASMPYFVLMAFASPATLSSMTPLLFFVVCLTKYYICFMASGYIPLPGGTGMMEIAFIALFGTMVDGNLSIVWSLLIYRFLSYYLIIIHGFIHELSHIIKGIVKNSKQKKMLQANATEEIKQ